MKRRLLTVLLIFIVVFITGCDIFDISTPLQTPDNSDESSKAPDFTVYDAEGKAIKLSDFHGAPVILNFWASWCPPCRNEMPEFEEAYREYGNEIHFLMVNMTDGSGETIDSAQSFIGEYGYSFPVYFDTSGSAAMAYGISSIPTTFFIDKNGIVKKYAVGSMNKTSLQKGINIIKD